VWFRSTPLRTGFTDPVSEPPTFPTPVPPLRIKLRSARYRRAALSLCYGGVAEPGRIERLTSRSLRCSRPLEEPTSAGSNWRKAAGADPQTFRSHSVSNGSPGPPGIAFLAFERHWMAERDRHRTIGHRWPPGASNTVEEPTSARSGLPRCNLPRCNLPRCNLADDKRVELSARWPHRVSGARPEPSGDVIHLWYPRSDSNGHCLVSKTSASYRWATGANGANGTIRTFTDPGLKRMPLPLGYARRWRPFRVTIPVPRLERAPT
jgi:hypothetical protein